MYDFLVIIINFLPKPEHNKTFLLCWYLNETKTTNVFCHLNNDTKFYGKQFAFEHSSYTKMFPKKSDIDCFTKTTLKRVNLMYMLVGVSRKNSVQITPI